MGITREGYVEKGLEDYEKRLSHYISWERKEVPSVKNAGSLSAQSLKEKEGQLLKSYLQAGDYLVLLDENGTVLSSEGFSEFIGQRMNSGIKNLVFMVGGAYGFSKELYDRSDYKLSLSKMTLTHQMVRLFFTEQVYRAFTILKGEKYHHS
jgi:23S rRNA (pseudouridine1915-N3)-methyltransferase